MLYVVRLVVVPKLQDTLQYYRSVSHSDSRKNSYPLFKEIFIAQNVQVYQKVSVHLMITIQKVTSNVQSVPRQSPYIDTPNCVLEDRVQYSTVCILKVFCDDVFFCTVIVSCAESF
jgi:hypothetical protein